MGHFTNNYSPCKQSNKTVLAIIHLCLNISKHPQIAIMAN